MKICHLTSVHRRYDTRILYKECTSLARAGFQVTLIVADGKPEEIAQGVRILSACVPASSRFLRVVSSARAVYQEALRQNADLYHIHDPELLPYALQLKKRGKKVIFDSHEDIPLDILTKKWIPAGLRHLTSIGYATYERHVLKQLDAVITVTPHIAERLEQFCKQIFTITNYPHAPENPVQQNSPPENTPPTFCFAGRIGPLSQHEVILDAMNQLPESTYLLAGPIPLEYKKRLQQKPAWKQVQYQGILSRQDVFNMFKRAHAGLAIVDYIVSLGGKRGTLGVNKIFEYMIAGLPVICTDMTLWKEIIDGNNCGITVPANYVNKIVEALRFISDHPKEAQEMGLRGIEAIRRKYNWQNQEVTLFNVYEKVLSTH